MRAKEVGFQTGEWPALLSTPSALAFRCIRVVFTFSRRAGARVAILATTIWLVVMSNTEGSALRHVSVFANRSSGYLIWKISKPPLLTTYANALHGADEAIVFYDPEVLKHKRIPALEPSFVREAFGHPNSLKIFTNPAELHDYVQRLAPQNRTLLLMSSGWFGNADWSW